MNASITTYSLGVVKDLELGGILDVIDLGPVDGDRATGLDMGQEDLAARKSRSSTIEASIGNKDLLGLVEVGNVAISIDTAGEVTGTGTMTRSARDDGKGEGFLVDLCSLDLGEAIDDG